MKIIILLLTVVSLSISNNIFSQKVECNWFYELKDNGFDETTRRVSAVGVSIFSPSIDIYAWPNDPTQKGYYGLMFSWSSYNNDRAPQLIGGDQDKVQASIKVNGVNKKYVFDTKYSSGPTLVIIGGAKKEFLNDLKIGTELNIVINYGQAFQSAVYKYDLNCSSSCITKLMAP
jgi:hypothetical protein